MKQKIDNSSGFTLIEVLIAALILVFGLLAMGTFLGSLMTKNSTNERRTMAVTIAEGQLEDVRTQAMKTDLTSADDIVGLVVTTAAGPFTVDVNIVEDFVDLADEVKVTVDWEGTGDSQVVMYTLINN